MLVSFSMACSGISRAPHRHRKQSSARATRLQEQQMLELTGARDYDQAAAALKAALEKLIVSQCERRFPDEALKRGLLENCLVSNATRELEQSNAERPDGSS